MLHFFKPINKHKNKTIVSFKNFKHEKPLLPLLWGQTYSTPNSQEVKGIEARMVKRKRVE